MRQPWTGINDFRDRGKPRPAPAASKPAPKPGEPGFVPQPVDPEAFQRREDAKRWAAWKDKCRHVLKQARENIARSEHRRDRCAQCKRYTYTRMTSYRGKLQIVCERCKDGFDRWLARQEARQ